MAAAFNRRMRKTARTVVWEGAGAQSPAPDPICAPEGVRCGSEGLQVLHKLTLLVIVQVRLKMSIVMLNDFIERGEAAIVIKAAPGPGEQATQRCGTIPSVRRSVRLKVVNPDFCRG